MIEWFMRVDHQLRTIIFIKQLKFLEAGPR